MEVKTERSTPIAAFMAFGTKGDIYPIAAVAAAFACDQRKYEVLFITHSAHQDLAAHLAENNVTYTPVSSPSIIPPPESDENDENSLVLSFCSQKRTVTREHRRECRSIMDRIFGDGLGLYWTKLPLRMLYIILPLHHFRGISNGNFLFFANTCKRLMMVSSAAVAIHHGGSGSTVAALRAGVPQVVCPFIFDQFYWAERMYWLGVAPEPLRRNLLLPENSDDVSIREGADVLKNAINRAMSPEIKAPALQISEKISQENGVSEAVRILKEEMS